MELPNIRHLVETKLPINVGILCNFIDQLCTSLVSSGKYKSSGTLHNVALPRSWILQYLRLEETVQKERATNLYFLFVEPLSILLEDIHTGNSGISSIN